MPQDLKTSKFDQSVLPHWQQQEALSLIAGNRDLFAKILKLYLVKVPELLTEFAYYLEINDQQQLKINAHNIRGISASIGATRLTHLSKCLEENINDLTHSECQIELQHLQALFDEFQKLAENR